jgi:hypothetical protein
MATVASPVAGSTLATVAPASIDSIDSIGAASAGEAVRTRVPARKQAGATIERQ